MPHLEATLADAASCDVAHGADAQPQLTPGGDLLARCLAGAVAELSPVERLIVAERLVGYVRDLLVAPCSRTGARRLDEAAADLARLVPGAALKARVSDRVVPIRS